MNVNPSFSKLVAGAALALVAASATAAEGPASTAIARVTGLQFGVLDLQPDDGVAASFRPDSVSGDLAVVLNAQTDSLHVSGAASEILGLASEYSSAQAMYGATGTIGAVANARSDLGPGGRANALLDQRFGFFLSPNAALTVAGTSEYAVMRQTPDFSVAWGKTRTLIEMRSAGQPELLTYMRREVEVPPGADSSNLEDFWLGFANTTDNEIYVDVSFNFAAQTAVGTIPVPEPFTYSMLGAGLLLLGTVKRRSSPRRDKV